MSLIPFEPVLVHDLVTPQAGSVVSRKVLAASGGRVVLFAFAAGEGLSEHTTPFEAMIVLLEGRARVGLDSQTFVMEAGSLMPLPAGRPHSVHAVTDLRLALVMVQT